MYSCSGQTPFYAHHLQESWWCVLALWVCLLLQMQVRTQGKKKRLETNKQSPPSLRRQESEAKKWSRRETETLKFGTASLVQWIWSWSQGKCHLFIWWSVDFNTVPARPSISLLPNWSCEGWNSCNSRNASWFHIREKQLFLVKMQLLVIALLLYVSIYGTPSGNVSVKDAERVCAGSGARNVELSVGVFFF